MAPSTGGAARGSPAIRAGSERDGTTDLGDADAGAGTERRRRDGHLPSPAAGVRRDLLVPPHPPAAAAGEEARTAAQGPQEGLRGRHGGGRRRRDRAHQGRPAHDSLGRGEAHRGARAGDEDSHGEAGGEGGYVSPRALHLLGSPVLRQRSAEVERVDDEVRALIADLFETMRFCKGVGLAANQVGVARRVAVVETEPGQPFALVNPVVVEAQGFEKAEEGCLSIPDVYGDVERATRVVVEAADENGARRRIEGTGLLARG